MVLSSVTMKVLIPLFWCSVIIALSKSSTDKCLHYYLSQPFFQLTCNPYHDLTPRLLLECNAYGETKYELQWFRQHKVKAADSVQDFEPELLSQSTRRISISMRTTNNFTKTRLVISKPLTEHIGIYWCQIGIGRDNITNDYLQPSQQITILPEDSYNGLPPCSPDVFLFDATSRCATEPPPKQVSSSDTPPTATSSSSTQENGNENTNDPTSPWSMQPSVTGSFTEETENSPIIPYWSYALIATGVVAVAAVLLLTGLCLCKILRSKRDDRDTGSTSNVLQGQASHRLTEQLCPPLMGHNVCISEAHIVHNPIPPPRCQKAGSHNNVLPLHLSVARVASNNSDYGYVEIENRSQMSSTMERSVSPAVALTDDLATTPTMTGASHHLQSGSTGVLDDSSGEAQSTTSPIRATAGNAAALKGQRVQTKPRKQKPVPPPKKRVTINAVHMHTNSEPPSSAHTNNLHSANGSTYHALHIGSMASPAIYTAPVPAQPSTAELKITMDLSSSESEHQLQAHQPGYKTLNIDTIDYMSLYASADEER